MTDEERFYWYVILNMDNVSVSSVRAKLERFGPPQNFYESELIPSWQKEKLYKDYRKLESKNIKMILRDDPDFPGKLHYIDDEPYGLFVRGEMPNDAKKVVSIIGARRASAHGKWMASKLASDLTELGITVISGMAEGIDGSAHLGALSANGKTYAVLGSGIDVCFPMSHTNLYNRIIENGGVISEYGPGTPGLPYHFPLRNRIISGLSDVVIVVEAREHSGSLITVSTALSQGKEVMAVPGRPDDVTSEGCLRLLKEGACICTKARDVLDVLEISSDNKIRPNTDDVTIKYEEFLSMDELLVFNTLTREPRHIEDISTESGFDIAKTAKLLISLELKGLANSVTSGLYQKDIHLP